MDHETLDRNLNRITTLWSVVRRAHQGSEQEVAAAQQQLLQRYSKSIYRYLLGAVRNPDVADELAQEFALRLIRGDFRGVDPGRGRFRDFVKGVLFHLIADYHRRQQRGHCEPLPAA